MEDPRFTSRRFGVMALVCISCFGSYFVYDIPSSLQLQLKGAFDMSDLQFNMLYSVYSFPNIFLPFFSGLFIDKVGVRFGLVLFAALVVASQVLFALGASVKLYWVILLSRFVFGLGGESLSVAQSVVTSKWFLGKELSLAMGLALSVSRLGSVMNDWIEPAIVTSDKNLTMGLSLGLLVCCFSLAATLMLYKMDEQRDLTLQVPLTSPIQESSSIKLNFSPVFWLLTMNCVFAYVSVLSFNNIASGYFHSRFGCSAAQSGILISVTFLTAALCTPVLGYFVDKIKKRSLIILGSTCLLTMAHFILCLISDNNSCFGGAAVLIMLGLGYSSYAAVVWSSVPLVVPEEQIATAFGLVTSVQNLGLTVCPLIVGMLGTHYMIVSWFFVCVGMTATIAACALLYTDRETTKSLWTSQSSSYKSV
mmetsp:Transcript_14208/g.26807  ORF Transcript_14208/g.26807 Transcript_14208/m.26807 type:complete len:421 (+) Transcript_14208:1821-3083(+)